MDKELAERKKVRRAIVAKVLNGAWKKYHDAVSNLPEEEANLIGLELMEEASFIVASTRMSVASDRYKESLKGRDE
jgi:hypothetical protein